MPIDAPATHVCAVAAEIYSTADQGVALQSAARKSGYQVSGVHVEFEDVTVFTVVVADKPLDGDELGALTGLGSLDRLDALRQLGAYVGNTRPEQRDGCVPNPYYAITNRVRSATAPGVFEFERSGAEKALGAATRLSLSPVKFSGPDSVIVRLSPGLNVASFEYRVQRGDFGKVISLGVLASPETLRALRDRTPN